MMNMSLLSITVVTKVLQLNGRRVFRKFEENGNFGITARIGWQNFTGA